MLYYCICFRITSVEVWLILKQYYGTAQKPSSPAFCRIPSKKNEQASTIFKICLSISTGWWECLCHVKNCQRSVRDNRNSLQRKKKIIGETKPRHKTCSTSRVSHGKEIKPFPSQHLQLRPFSSQTWENCKPQFCVSISISSQTTQSTVWNQPFFTYCLCIRLRSFNSSLRFW